MLFQYLLTIQIAASITMLFFWGVQVKTRDASLVDFIWSLSICTAILYLLLSLWLFDIRHITIAMLGIFWSLRLSIYLFIRIRRDSEEDRRYQAMRASMGSYAHLGFFFFYQAQALFVSIFTAPIAIALMTSSQELTQIDLVGILIFLIAILGEGLADQQLMRFKAKHAGKKITCQSGLWYYSRHPNYFFEWIHWFAYPFFSYSSEYFWISCLAPFLMLIFLLKLTGIPHVERESLTNKPDYKDYVNATSAFIPWFKKNK